MHYVRKDENLTTADISKSGEVADKRERPEDIAGEAAAEPRVGGPKLVTSEAKLTGGEAKGAHLLPEGELREMRTRWDKIQAAFVDEPRQAVQDADNLVAVAVKRLAEQFAEERSRVEQQWTGDEISTETLRQALRHYRTFFERLLSI